MVAFLQAKCAQHIDIVQELSTLWANPEERLQQVASTDTLLAAELLAPDKDASDVNDDARSEFSAMSYQSYASNLSRTSGISSKSGTSTVSILSNLSLSSSTSSSSSIAGASKKSFSIKGIEHALLSRGTADTPAGLTKSEATGKKQKKNERKKVKGEGRDVWGLRRECLLCNDLWQLGNIKVAAVEVKGFVEALLLLAGPGDFELACSLQLVMDQYSSTVQSNPSPIAPGYPSDWLGKRMMLSLLRFQDCSLERSVSTSSAAAAVSSKSRLTTWWEKAAQGIQAWREYRRISLE